MISLSCECTRPFWSYLIKYSGHIEKNTRQPVTRIMKGETLVKKLNGKFLPKLQLSQFTNHLKVQSRQYMSLRKRRSYEYRHCRSVWQKSQSLWIAARCLDKSSIKTSWASLPAKQAITVGFSSGFNVKLPHDWTNFDLQSLCQSVAHICLTPESCLSLTNTRQDTSQ